MLRKLNRTLGTHTKSDFELLVNGTNSPYVFYPVRIGSKFFNVIRMKV